MKIKTVMSALKRTTGVTIVTDIREGRNALGEKWARYEWTARLGDRSVRITQRSHAIDNCDAETVSNRPAESWESSSTGITLKTVRSIVAFLKGEMHHVV